MKRLIVISITGLVILLSGCGATTPQEACVDHQGLRAGSIEKGPDGEVEEARCNDGTEIEYDGSYWSAG